MIKKKTKCLHIIYSGIGGVSSVVFSLLDSRLKKETRQEILFTGPTLINDYSFFCHSRDVKFSYVKTKNFIFFLKSIYLVFEKIRIHKPDIVFLHDFNIIPCLLYKFFYKTKLIFVNHTTLASPHAWKIKLITKFLFYIDAIVFVNKIDFDQIYKKNNFYSRKFYLIENGINLNEFSFVLKKTKSKIFRIGMACRVDSSRPYYLIPMALLEKNLMNLNITFSLCGDGTDLSNFKSLIKKNNLCNKIKLEGFLNNKKIKRWYRSLDLYVQASYGEGMSTAILQAMSMKIPVLGSNVPGIQNFLDSKKYFGMLFENNPKDLSKKIYFFYKLNKYKKNKYINNQYKLIKLNYSLDKMIDQYTKLIHKI